MRRPRIVGLLLASMATLGQQQRPVEITSEPRHHLVFENEYVRVFDVTVEPRGSTLVHHHSHDYLFVTLGDSDVVSARPGEKPVELLLKDGDTRFTTGNFSHAAINKSEKPFHNITIELLKPSSNVKTCTESCQVPVKCNNEAGCAKIVRQITSDQWTLSAITLPPSGRLDDQSKISPYLLVAVSKIDISKGKTGAMNTLQRSPGGLDWVAAGASPVVANAGSTPATFTTLEFHQ